MDIPAVSQTSTPGGIRKQLFLAGLVAGLLATSSGLLGSQSLRFEHLTQEDGLSQGFITALAQDSIGFLWIGTQDGLNRFDGYEFKSYYPDPNDPGSLPSGNIRALLIDAEGTLWVGTRAGGLSRYDPLADRFETWRPDPKDPLSLSSDYVTVLHEDRAGVLWIGTRDGGLNRFNRDTGTFTVYLHDPEDPNSLARDSVSSLLQDRAGRFWVGTRGAGLDRWDETLGGFVHHRWDGKGPTSIRHGYVTSLLEDSRGQLWVGTRGGVSLWAPETDDFRPWRPEIDLPTAPFADQVRSMVETADGSVWIAAQDFGLYRIDLKNGRIRALHNEPDDPHSLTGAATALLEDRTGTLWIGTPNGLDRHAPRTRRLQAYRRPESGAQELAIESPWAVVDDGQGGLWVGGQGQGLRHINLAEDQWQSWRHSEDDPESLPSDSVYALTRGRDGGLWIGTNKGLAFLEPSGSLRLLYPKEAEPLGSADNAVYSLLLAKDGTLWVGTNSGLARLDPDGSSFHGFDFGTLANGSTRAVVFSIAEDPDGKLWIGTFRSGLLQIDPKTGAVEQYAREMERLDGIPSDRINAVYVDGNGAVWAGSPLGLHQFDPANDHFVSLHRANGLPTDVVESIVEDLGGALWVGTSNGLARLDRDRETIEVFTGADGLPSNEFNQIAATRMANGSLAFGTTRGFVVFDPRLLVPDPKPPAPVLTDVLIFNESVPVAGRIAVDRANLTLPVAAPYLSRLAIGHTQQVLSFEFAALHFGDSQRNRYRYQLDGWDPRWISTDGRHRVATYTKLRAGNYTFRVQAALPNGDWSQEETQLALVVKPAPWKSWWAYALYGLAAFGLLAWSVHRQRVVASFERNRADEEQRINRELRRVLGEKQQISSAFHQVVSHEVADAWLEGKVSTKGEIREVTVLFADVRGFTALSETMPAREVITLVNEYLGTVVPAITGHGGVVDKFVGDEVFAVFGAPIAIDGDALCGVRSALEMQNLMAQLNEQREAEGRPRVEIGIGINTGAVVAGAVGSEERSNYTVLGSVVNEGARLCSAANAGQILISGSTYLQSQQYVEVRELPPIDAKNVSFPLKAFEVLKLISQKKMYGRDPE